MRRTAIMLVIAGIIAACSSLPASGDGVVGLEVQLPDSLFLVIGDTLVVHARALNLHGDPVAADIRWRTPDTTLVTLDSLMGVVVALADTGAARIQASTGSLLSDVIRIPLRPVPPTPDGSSRTPP